MNTLFQTSPWNDLLHELKNNSEPAGIGWFNTKGELLSANQLMCLFLGTNQEDLNPLYQLINPDFFRLNKINLHEKLIFEGLLTIGNMQDISFVFKSKIYREKDVFMVYAEPDLPDMFAQNKNMSRLNQEVNNLQRQLIKEKKKLEQALNELKETQQMLIHSEKMNAMGQLVAGIAHEINNPLSYVTNNIHEIETYTGEFLEAFHELEDLYKRDASDEAEEKIQTLKEKYELDYLQSDLNETIADSISGALRVKKIVEDLRRFSRLDESDVKNIDLKENINSTLSIIQSEIDKKEIDFSFDFKDNIKINCYPGQLNQAILNILMNAIQAVNNRGKIVFSIIKQQDWVCIKCEDNGCGIKPENQKKIFNPFYTTKPVGSGTGIGLSITHKIICDLHKGKINLTSSESDGTSLELLIPYK